MRLRMQAAGAAFVSAVLGVAVTASASLIGFNFTTAASSTPDPQNWNRVSSAAGTLTNVMNDQGAASGVDITWGGGATGGFVYLGSTTLAADATPQFDYDLSGMTGYALRSNGEFFIELSGLAASTEYEYWFVGYRAGSAIQNVVDVSDGDSLNAFTFTQSITSTANNGRFLVNTTNANNSMHWDDLSFTTTSSSQGTIRFDWHGDGQTTVIGALAIRPIGAVPGPGAILLLAFAPLVGGRRRR